MEKLGVRKLRQPFRQNNDSSDLYHRCYSQDMMRNSLAPLRTKLGREPDYFRKVYTYTFEIAREEGQRSLGKSNTSGSSLGCTVFVKLVSVIPIGIETAREFWKLLLPCGLDGGALSHTTPDGEDVSMDGTDGWRRGYQEWWFEFLNEKGLKGVSKDTWNMVRISFPYFPRSLSMR